MKGRIPVPAALAEAVASSGDPADQRVTWNPTSWRGTFVETAAIGRLENTFGNTLSRREVCSEFERSTAAGFFAAMVWGFGTTGYGAFRTKRIMETAGEQMDERLDAVVTAARRSPADGYRALVARRSRLRFLGPAFGTKVTYFAGLSAGATGRSLPLISDINTAKAVWHLSGKTVLHPVSTLRGYVAYCELVNEWADELGTSPDRIELALFSLGGGGNVTWSDWPH